MDISHLLQGLTGERAFLKTLVSQSQETRVSGRIVVNLPLELRCDRTPAIVVDSTKFREGTHKLCLPKPTAFCPFDVVLKFLSCVCSRMNLYCFRHHVVGNVVHESLPLVVVCNDPSAKFSSLTDGVHSFTVLFECPLSLPSNCSHSCPYTCQTIRRCNKRCCGTRLGFTSADIQIRENHPLSSSHRPGSEHFEVFLHDGPFFRRQVESVVHSIIDLGVQTLQ